MMASQCGWLGGDTLACPMPEKCLAPAVKVPGTYGERVWHLAMWLEKRLFVRDPRRNVVFGVLADTF